MVHNQSLRPPFIDIGTVGQPKEQKLEDVLGDVCEIAVDTARMFFPGKTEKIAMTLIERGQATSDPRLLVAAWDNYPDEDLQGVFFKGDVRLSNSMSGSVITKGDIIILPDVTQAQGYYSLNHKIKSAMGAPIGYGGEIFGALCVESELPEQFTRTDAWNLEQIARNSGVALRLYRDSIINLRTGAYNSNFYMRKMEIEVAKSVRDGTELGVLLMDIDYLKEFNSALGLPEGSRMIRTVAKVIQRNAKDYFVVRYGGDEFAVIAPGATKEECLTMGETIRREVERVHIDHPNVPRKFREYATISVGVAHSSDPLGPQGIEDTADFCVRAAKGEYYPRPRPGEDLTAFNELRDTKVRNQVVNVVEYGRHLDSAHAYVARLKGLQVLWARHRAA